MKLLELIVKNNKHQLSFAVLFFFKFIMFMGCTTERPRNTVSQLHHPCIDETKVTKYANHLEIWITKNIPADRCESGCWVAAFHWKLQSYPWLAGFNNSGELFGNPFISKTVYHSSTGFVSGHPSRHEQRRRQCTIKRHYFPYRVGFQSQQPVRALKSCE